MKIVILAGGKGSRLSEYTKSIPKPMVKVMRLPIIVRIINHYIKFGFNEFIIATGYKNKIIKNYFKKNFLNVNIKSQIYRCFLYDRR
jgi:glucose-1-phosphate cytidylyltransferase